MISPPIPALIDANETEEDWLYDVVRGGYYGHPNPTRCEFVFDGGHPSAAPTPGWFAPYPVGVQPDRNYRGIVYDFGKNLSPDGIIEYRGNWFGGALDHCLLISRYSGSKDIVAVRLQADGSVDRVISGIPGLSRLYNPISLTEDPRSGALYVTEFGALGAFGGQRIALLRPTTPKPPGAAGAAAPDPPPPPPTSQHNDTLGD